MPVGGGGGSADARTAARRPGAVRARCLDRAGHRHRGRCRGAARRPLRRWRRDRWWWRRRLLSCVSQSGTPPHDSARARVTGMTTAPDVLAGWVATPFSAAGATHDVYRKGTGPGVVLLPEAPGMTPEVLGLAEHLVDRGFTVAAPSLFGTPGRPISVGYAAGTMARVCISREFAAFARRADRPVAEYVRALARELHADVGGRGVGVIGMCFTGGFALAAAVEPAVLAPVASQPSVPFPIGSRKEDLGMSDRERDAVVRRVREDRLCALGLRFSEDRFVPRQRFERLVDCWGTAGG